MPILAGWLTGEQVPQETIEQTISAMAEVLNSHGGQPAQMVQPGAGLVAFSDPAYAMQQNDDPPVLDWVPDRRTLVYRRPLSGLHPLYYVENWPAQGNLLFASEIKALLAVGVPRRLHLGALDALARYGFIPAPWTAFKDIHVVPAGSILRWQHAKTVVNHATDFHCDDPLPGPGVQEQLFTLLSEASAHSLPPHEQLVALTAGNAPSALSIALAAQHTTTRFNVASIGYKKSLAAKIWREAERVADGCQHPFLAITGVDQPEFWMAALLATESPCVDTRSLALHQLLHTISIETEARVAISGAGGHLLSATHGDEDAEARQGDMLRSYRQSASLHAVSSMAETWSREMAARLQEEEHWEDTLHARKLERRAAKFADRALGRYYLDLHLRLPDLVVGPMQHLATQERMAVRSPYLNPRVMDMMVRLPAVLEDGTPKDLLLARLAQRLIPGSGEIPSGLSLSGPIASLLQVEGSDLLQQTLTPEAIRAIGIFDAERVDELLKRKGKSFERQLLLVFTTQLLCRMFGLEM